MMANSFQCLMKCKFNVSQQVHRPYIHQICELPFYLIAKKSLSYLDFLFYDKVMVFNLELSLLLAQLSKSGTGFCPSTDFFENLFFNKSVMSCV